MWLSNVHTWVNPYVSARFARSTTRADRRRGLEDEPEVHGCQRVVGKPRSTADVCGSGQRRRDDLAAGVEVDALGAVHVGVAEEAGLPAAEAVVADRHRDRHVDADHADVDVPLELAGRAAVAGEDRGAVAVRVGVDQRHALVVGRRPASPTAPGRRSRPGTPSCSASRRRAASGSGRSRRPGRPSRPSTTTFAPASEAPST